MEINPYLSNRGGLGGGRSDESEESGGIVSHPATDTKDPQSLICFSHSHLGFRDI